MTPEDKEQLQPPQQQHERPGKRGPMDPKPVTIKDDYRASGRLQGKVAIVTGGDSGIGRAIAVHFAREGADVAIVYLSEHEDAREAGRMAEEAGGRVILLAGDVADRQFCDDIVAQTLNAFERLDVLVNNSAEQHPQERITDITDEQWDRTFRTNIYGYFYLTRAAVPHLPPGSSIINTTSVTAYAGNPTLLDYSSTKGAIVAFTRSLALMLAEQGVRVNGVAPGPIWTPLIPSTFPPDKVATFGSDTPLQRPGQPAEVATCYVFLASDDASYVTGQVMHPNGGRIVNG